MIRIKSDALLSTSSVKNMETRVTSIFIVTKDSRIRLGPPILRSKI